MPEYVVDRLAEGLNDQRKPVKGSKVLVLGLAYKADVSDTRESPSFELLELIDQRGGEVAYADPFIPETYPVRRHDIALSSVELTAENVASFDAIVISTAHSDIDYELLANNAQLIIDTRNAMAEWADELGDRLLKA